MSPETWRRVGDLFAEVVEASPSQREARLARDDIDLEVRREVERLLRHDGPARPDFFLNPVTWNLKAQLTRGEESQPRAGGAGWLAEVEQMLGRDALPAFPTVGDAIDDFELLRELGRGASGVVFLARQISLARLVALKATADRGAEARTMASLEHRHIVAVYSERVDPEKNLRLLCMQYVPGPALDAVVRRLRSLPRKALSGRTLLEAIEDLSPGPVALDAQALREREALARSGYVEAACWIVARLAEALDYAHRRGVVHRDVKPGNILLDPYGRPLLADFSISRSDADGNGAEEVFGGTLAYMAPEHLDAFDPQNPAGLKAVDERSDVYSLGVVLYEMLALTRPFADELSDGDRRGSLRCAAERRRGEPPSLRDADPQAPEVVDRVVRRCLHGRPEKRFSSAAELAEALDGCRRHLAMQSRLPPLGRAGRMLARRPFLSMVLLITAAHLAGNVFTPLYNAALVFPGYTPAQEWSFIRVMAIYALTVFPLLFVMLAPILAPRMRVWRDVNRGDLGNAERIHQSRRAILHAPWWAVLFACLGWGPLLAAIPWGLRASEAPLPPGVFGYFVLSVVFSWLGAAAWSYFVAQLFVLRILYPRLWPDARHDPQIAEQELRGVAARLKASQFVLGAAPLAVAMMLVLLGPGETSASALSPHRLLAAAAIVAGLFAFQFATGATRFLERTVAALTHHEAGAASR